MHKRMITGLVVLALVFGSLGIAAAADEAKPLYVQTIEKYRSPVLFDVGGREYKFLIDPAKVKGKTDDGLKEIWKRVKVAAAKNGFTVTEKEKNPFAIEHGTKEYFDTADQLLWQAGYQIRIANKYGDDDRPSKNVTLNVKNLKADARVVLADPLFSQGGEKTKVEAEGNVGLGPGGTLHEYIEKGVTITLPADTFGATVTLADVGRFVPQLLSLGIPANTPLVGKKAYSTRMKPGAVVLPGTAPCGVSMEAFADKEGGVPYLYDFSFGYGDLDFYNIPEIHAAGEKFMMKVLHGELAGIAMPESEKWGGSKVRKLMNRPLSAVKTFGPAVDPLDELYGVASPPAYIKHYEADLDGRVLTSPYLQVATREYPAILDVSMAPFNWAIDLDGRVTIVPEAAHPLGRTYANGFVRPEDNSKRKPGTRENYGHVSSLAGGPGRISGEINYDKGTKTYTVNNKSGRYSKHNKDRTPQQFVNAVNLIRSVVDTNGIAWGPALYLLEYSPADIRAGYENSPEVQYDDPAKKSRPHLVVLPGAPAMPSTDKPIGIAATPAIGAPAAAAPAPAEAAPAKAKAAHNDDPS